MDVGEARVLDLGGLDRLLAALVRRGYRVEGPVVRDGAIVHGRLATAADLPAGWHDDQGPGTYRLSDAGDGAVFGWAVGPVSWKPSFLPARQVVWQAASAAAAAAGSVDLGPAPGGKASDGSTAAVPDGLGEPEGTAGPGPLAIVGARPCEVASLGILDRVLAGGPVPDPDYADRRNGTFTVVASNAYGAGPVSLASNAVNPLEAAPGVATSVVATPLALSALVRWTAAPANGAVIARYTVTATPGGQSCVTVTTSCTVTGLLSTQAYTFTVTATNVVGTGPVSLASAPVTPKVPGPNAPSVVTVRRAGSGTLVVSWRPGPVTTVPVTGFLAVATAPNGARAGSCAVTSGTSCVIRGLSDGTTYSVAVYAQSASGTSSPVVKAGVKVAGPPSVPVIVTSRRGPGVAILIVRAPRVFHGAPVAYYQILLGGRWSVQPVKGRTVIVLRGLARHARFVLRVRAVTFAGASAPSNAVVLVTL